MATTNYKKICLILGVIFLCYSSAAHADRIAEQKEYTVYSQNRDFFIKMIPSYSAYGISKGTAYRAASGTILWNIDWYADKVILGNDGKSLIRFGSLATDSKGLSDLAVGFYWEGRELRSYKVRDLIIDKDMIRRTATHYFWQTGYDVDEEWHTLKLITADKQALTFDIRSGNIVSKLILNDEQIRDFRQRKGIKE